MATWGAYFTSFVGKTTEEPIKDSSQIGSGSTVEKNQSIVESTASKIPPTTKIAEPKESSQRVEGVKKLYDLNPLPDSKLDQSPPKFNSNAARVAKLFGYGSPATPATPAASGTPQTTSESTAPLSLKPPTKPVAPTNSENLSIPQKSTIQVTPAKPPVTVTPQPTVGLPSSVVTISTPENVINDVKKPSGLLAWAFGSTAKTKEPIVETKDTKSSLLSATSKDQQMTASRNSIKMLSELQTSLQSVKIYNENIPSSSEANLAPSELNGTSTRLASKSILNAVSPSRFNVNAPTQNKFESSQSNTSVFNSSRPQSVASSASASTRYNQSSGLSSPMSRRDSIFSRFSTSSRPYDNSLASVEEKVAREIRLQAEKEHRMKLLAFTKSIEEMRIEREKMESDRKRMMDEKAAFERDEYQLKDRQEQMRIFMADFKQEQEREAKEREKLRLEQEEEKKRQEEVLKMENEEKIRKQNEEREQREEQERIMLKKEEVAKQDDTRENNRNDSPIPNSNLDTEPKLAKSGDKEELKKMGTNQEDEDDFSIYDDYYDEESDQGKESLDFQKQLKSSLQNDKAQQQQIEEEEYEKELERQRSLQASRLHEEEEERRRYAEEQAKRFRQQRPTQTGPPPGALDGSPPQMKLPQMGLPQMGSPQMRPQMGLPQMRPQMRPQMGSPQMRPQMAFQQVKPQMSSPQIRPAKTGQQTQQREMLAPRQQLSEEEIFRRQRETEESEDEEIDKEEEMRKAEIKMRKAFAEMSIQKGTAPIPAQELELQPRPPRNQNPTYIRPPGGLPAGPRKGNGGLPARPR
ncbi:hypothetical protein EPUL_006016 [Erysiphe pulchra]|uniref:Uncharacterized protein n=1 Tax=Erysiphe pulchra TaxID=225359 RepID=A0A2S4PLC6_9PEZI|nr:hypothetical protein EPUL_006016 [Erysiphe pulchra]